MTSYFSPRSGASSVSLINNTNKDRKRARSIYKSTNGSVSRGSTVCALWTVCVCLSFALWDTLCCFLLTPNLRAWTSKNMQWRPFRVCRWRLIGHIGLRLGWKWGGLLQGILNDHKVEVPGSPSWQKENSHLMRLECKCRREITKVQQVFCRFCWECVIKFQRKKEKKVKRSWKHNS